MINENEEYEVIEAMKKYGGSFVVQLANLYERGDANNRLKIRLTWSEYWAQYKEMAEKSNG